MQTKKKKVFLENPQKIWIVKKHTLSEQPIEPNIHDFNAKITFRLWWIISFVRRKNNYWYNG